MRRDPQPLLRRAAMKIAIDAGRQELKLMDGKRVLKRYAVSTAKKGLGEQNGSFCTPRGRHIVRAKLGGGLPLGAVFVRRRPTGEVWTPELHARYPGRDWILTRILWLSGCEPGRNRLGDVDTMRRYIYIHGTPDSAELGKPGSIGCVRMRNKDIAELYDLIPAYTEVEIAE
jgi:lipoprotein-anchoring transpeptidase ErfK/SrfK